MQVVFVYKKEAAEEFKKAFDMSVGRLHALHEVFYLSIG